MPRARTRWIARKCYAAWIAALLVFPTLAHGRQAPSDNWTRVAPGGDTTCGLHTPYSFFHRDGADPSRLLIYFQGGGACWDWVSCSGTFDSRVEDDEPARFRGIFDRSNVQNPFKDFAMVFVPYCTGDVHIGDASRKYGDDPSARPLAHRGYRNVAAVLAWLGGQKRTPKTVVVSGTSAGSYGALFHTPAIARMFPKALIVMLGDSGVPLLNDTPKVLQTWGAAGVLARLWNEPPEAVLQQPLRAAHLQVARSTPSIRMAQVTTDRDSVQLGFYLISGSPRGREVTYALLDDVRRAVPAFRSFVLDGADHGLFPTDAFYRYQVNGAYLKDWVGRLIRGEAVDDVRCAGCAVK